MWLSGASGAVPPYPIDLRPGPRASLYPQHPRELQVSPAVSLRACCAMCGADAACAAIRPASTPVFL
eukprot:2070896-Rhodomonas_salina.2